MMTLRQRPQRPRAGSYGLSRGRRHGVPREAFDALLAAQGGRCAICGTSDFGRVGPVVDHDHELARTHPHPKYRGCPACIRGILCSDENQGLGRFGDDPARLRAAADYIERARSGPARA